MSKKSDDWRDKEADRRNEFLESLIKDGNLTPERKQDYENEINGNKNSITRGDEQKK